MNILYFAWVRSKVGIGAESPEVPSSVTNVGELVAWLRERGEGYADAFSDLTTVRAAVNQEYVELDHPIAAGDEIAFFPPVTGG